MVSLRVMRVSMKAGSDELFAFFSTLKGFHA
jgi:hypothetical protein